MESVKSRKFGDLRRTGRSYGSMVWRIARKGLMRPPGMVVIEIIRKQSLVVSIAQDNDMIEQFSSDGADDPFNTGILPR